MNRRVGGSLLLCALFACGDIVVKADEDAVSVPVAPDAGGSVLAEPPLSCPTSAPSATHTVGDAGSPIIDVDAGVDTSLVTASSPVTSCSGVAGSCEYGVSADSACNQTFTCEDSAWFAIPSASTCFASLCPSQLATRAALDGQPCGPDAGAWSDSDEAVCAVSDATCTCTTGPSGASGSRHWVCKVPGGGCPVARPLVGTSCPSEGLYCDYGSCVSKRAPSLECVSGRWVDAAPKCDVVR